MTPQRAVFFDRDGVLNEILRRDGQLASPRSLDEFRPVPDLDSVRRLKRAGLLVFIITNQPEVARGKVTIDTLDAMRGEIARRVPIDDYRACPHDDADGCGCRKPRPGMIRELAQHWRVDLSGSFVVGDMWRDVDAARAAGCTPVLIRREYNADVEVALEADTLSGAVNLVLGLMGEQGDQRSRSEQS